MKRRNENHDSERWSLSDDDSGENLMEDMEGDYAAIPELDQYDHSVLDDGSYQNIDSTARRAAEAEIDARNVDRHGRLSGHLDDFGREDEAGRMLRRRDIVDVDLQETMEPTAGDINLETMDMPLREWIAQDRTRREIKRRFRRYLESDENHMRSIRSMCANNLASFEVSYQSLSSDVPILAIWVADAPRDIIEIFDEVANELVLSSEHFPDYGDIKDEVHVRIRDLPIIDTLRDLRQTHLNQLVRVNGVVTRRSTVFPQLKMVYFTCVSCDVTLGPFKQNNSTEVRPGSCPCCQRNGPFKLNEEQTLYGNYQKLAIQEAPGAVPPGRVPRHKGVVLLADLIDIARPGEEVEVTGVYVHSYDTGISGRAGFPIFSTAIEANHVAKRTSAATRPSSKMSEEEKRHVLRFARDPNSAERIASSLAPSIYGQKHTKRALAMAMFGGCPKNVDGKHRIRGDVNVMLLGDPGCAKSQLLKYCCAVMPRAIYTTGKGASAVGLTAGVHKDPLTKEWTLEGGALVLADNGMCCIDEFDKMNEQDRTSIHEAMEQQSISVSKAGIVTSLQARCSVVAAANPIGGQYDSSATFADNVELTDPILQRFDILCVLQDVVDPLLDEQLATYVVGSHRQAQTLTGLEKNNDDCKGDLPPPLKSPETGFYSGFNSATSETVPQDFLRKYLSHARDTCQPRLHSIDQDKISRLYADLRRESALCGGVPIAVRHLESLMRMAEAHAKMSLREHVRDDDVDAAISLLLVSFISAQKFSVRKSLERGFRIYLTRADDFFYLLHHALRSLLREAQTYATLRAQQRGNYSNDHMLKVSVSDFEAKAREINYLGNLEEFYDSDIFIKQGFHFDHERAHILWFPSG